MKQQLSTILLMAAFLTGCLFLSSCENDEKEIKDLYTRKLGIEEAKDVRLNYTNGGKAKALLTSPLMLRVQDTIPYLEFPNTVSVDFFNDAEAVESHLTSHYAKYRENQNIVYLKDSVKVYNLLKGDTLYCEELYWDRARTGAEFYTDKPVRIRTRTQILNGIGMEARQDFKEWHIIKPTGIITVPASQFPQ